MAKRNYTLRVEGKLDPAQVGKNINDIFPGFIRKAKQFFNTKEGLQEYVAWLKSIPEDDTFAVYRAELPEMEARLLKM